MCRQVNEYIDDHREEMLEVWGELVNLEGCALDGSPEERTNLNRSAQRLYELFTQAGVTCELKEYHPEAAQMLVGVIGKDRPGQPVILTGHFDTVFKTGTFGKNPFHIENGKAYGPGCLDMKGGIVIALYVIKALEKTGYADRPIRIAFCGDEEGGKYHNLAWPIFEDMARRCKFALNMETGPLDNSLCTGRKGAAGGQYTVYGVASHSGNNFEIGRNAVVEAAYKEIELHGLTNMETGTHMNVALVNGGRVVNQIPDRCTVTFSGRFATIEEMKKTMDAVEQIAAQVMIKGTRTEYTCLGGTPGVFEESKENLALWRFCDRISREMEMGEMGHVFLGGGSDAIEISRVTPTLCSCGVRGEWNHTDREYAVVDSLFERTKLWCEVLRRAEEFVI